jgi:hypothetical protein
MTVGMRELARNSKLLDKYDYVEVEDKKTHEYKGLFISPKYADEIRAFLDQKISEEKQKQLDEIMQFAGMFSGETENKTAQEIQASKEMKYGSK